MNILFQVPKIQSHPFNSNTYLLNIIFSIINFVDFI
jgi:hypothetical protein